MKSKIYLLQEWIGDNWDGYWNSVGFTGNEEFAKKWEKEPDKNVEEVEEIKEILGG